MSVIVVCILLVVSRLLISTAVIAWAARMQSPPSSLVLTLEGSSGLPCHSERRQLLSMPSMVGSDNGKNRVAGARGTYWPDWATTALEWKLQM